ncbi:helix-turn-helix transcriptional regulator [Faecalibacillus intestinalis]|uniref:helix-turn-helix transcriptional regulator n=1 Tax=Faecalibacillus intestinalis TaxID=1982626 RepID=UPI000E4FCF39|nr:helix-turn-helix transcriptional regulator [Faecalibacillus intestinalis]RHP77226.1 XRE family transcriptional regulator [Coprobacillus sp. OF03-2AA]
MRIDRIKFITELAKQELTLSDFSKKIGVNRTTLSNVKSGKSCRDDIAYKIANGLGVSIKDLIKEN